jgi:hypothetical protein
VQTFIVDLPEGRLSIEVEIVESSIDVTYKVTDNEDQLRLYAYNNLDLPSFDRSKEYSPDEDWWNERG